MNHHNDVHFIVQHSKISRQFLRINEAFYNHFFCFWSTKQQLRIDVLRNGLDSCSRFLCDGDSSVLVQNMLWKDDSPIPWWNTWWRCSQILPSVMCDSHWVGKASHALKCDLMAYLHGDPDHLQMGQNSWGLLKSYCFQHSKNNNNEEWTFGFSGL